MSFLAFGVCVASNPPNDDAALGSGGLHEVCDEVGESSFCVPFRPPVNTAYGGHGYDERGVSGVTLVASC